MTYYAVVDRSVVAFSGALPPEAACWTRSDWDIWHRPCGWPDGSEPPAPDARGNWWEDGPAPAPAAPTDQPTGPRAEDYGF